jgi:hypothetical protein
VQPAVPVLERIQGLPLLAGAPAGGTGLGGGVCVGASPGKYSGPFLPQPASDDAATSSKSSAHPTRGARDTLDTCFMKPSSLPGKDARIYWSRGRRLRRLPFMTGTPDTVRR